MQKLTILSFLVIICLNFSSVYGQKTKNATRQEYIDTYKELAVREMKRTGIPASITLAQGILESGNGNSRLARKANNHFGIKCHDWKGKKIRHDDDHNNECFRKYKSAYDSYKDHSEFLTTKNRYASLFTLEPTDYKGWAEGLKKAGYATSKNYHKALIKIIEENQLYALDQGVEIVKEPGMLLASVNESESTGLSRKIYENNRIKYIITNRGDTYTGISEELDLLPWELKKYNELLESSKIDSGQILYIQPKRKKAEAGKSVHIVNEGETMYYISQLYGIKLDILYEKNLMEQGAEPEVLQTLQLRKAFKGQKAPLAMKLKEQQEKEVTGKKHKEKELIEEDEIIFEFDFNGEE
ncbi:MAG: glucosaminidase domain-containing protein [Bacteroidales bacterium]|nr:MAG: glucosaminidase domain-containing protein [Bacteroidales bacterium]